VYGGHLSSHSYSPEGVQLLIKKEEGSFRFIYGAKDVLFPYLMDNPYGEGNTEKDLGLKQILLGLWPLSYVAG
jgi:hypothetical protein